VLVPTSTHLPGIKGGGPIRSIAALADQLGNDLDLFVLCRDPDYGDREPYAGVAIGEWMELGNAKVQYLPCTQFTASRYRTLLAELRPDVLYLNTLFSVREFIVPAIVALCRHRPVGTVVASRGCLDPGALSFKSTKKRLFLRLLRASRLPRAMTWQASTDMEARFISEVVGPVRITVASNLPSTSPGALPTRLRKEPGRLQIIFLSRISPKKNLYFLLEQLIAVWGEIDLTIAGPIEDRDYWARRKEFIDSELVR
jgi:glycosyltransferase involved in cell wall biosynthesis